MQVFLLLALSVGILVGSGMSQPAPAADFVVEAGEVSNDNVGTPIEAAEAARKTIKAILDAIKSNDVNALFKLLAHTQDDEKHAEEVLKSLKDLKMTVQSSKKSGEGKIEAVVLFTFKNEKKIGNVVLTKNSDSPTGWMLAQMPEKMTPAKHRTMLPTNKMTNSTIVAN